MRGVTANLIAACGVMVSGAASIAAPVLAAAPILAPLGVLVERDVAYGPLPQQTLTICKPAANDGKPRAGVVLIHGGGWILYDKTSLEPVCEALAHDGLFAATIDYRLARKTIPSTHWPAQLADAQLAVRWLRANATAQGLDGSRLCAYGESAGAHLAVFLAAMNTIAPTDMSGRLADQPVSVACAVDNFGPVDLTETGPVLTGLVRQVMGRRLRPGTRASFRAASPLFLIGRKTAPIFIEHAIGDKVVLPDQSFKLFAALTNAKVQARLTIYVGGHEWKNVPTREREFLAAEERQFLHLFLDAAPHKP